MRRRHLAWRSQGQAYASFLSPGVRSGFLTDDVVSLRGPTHLYRPDSSRLRSRALPRRPLITTRHARSPIRSAPRRSPNSSTATTSSSCTSGPSGPWKARLVAILVSDIGGDGRVRRRDRNGDRATLRIAVNIVSCRRRASRGARTRRAHLALPRLMYFATPRRFHARPLVGGLSVNRKLGSMKEQRRTAPLPPYAYVRRAKAPTSKANRTRG